MGKVKIIKIEWGLRIFFVNSLAMPSTVIIICKIRKITLLKVRYRYGRT